MKLLVIGGTGILSTAVVDEAVLQGMEVTMINRGSRKNLINDKAELIVGDVRNSPETIKEKLRGRHFDTVIDFLVWTKTQLQLSLSLFSDVADQYIFISSAQAYNTSIKGILTEESEMCQPLWKYSVDKCDAENYLIEFCKKNNVNYTIVRPGVNYGATRVPYGMFPAIGKHWTFVERIKAGKYIPTWNNGQNRLNLTRVEDLATGTLGLVGNKNAYNEDFNVVGDNVYSWMEVLQVMGNIIGKEVKTIDLPVDYYASELEGDEKEGLLGGRSQDLICSNDKLKSVYPSFTTKYNLEEGLRMTLDAYRNNKYFDGIDYNYEGVIDRIINKYRGKQNKNIEKQTFVQYSLDGLDSAKYSFIFYFMGYYCNYSFMKIVRKVVGAIAARLK